MYNINGDYIMRLDKYLKVSRIIKRRTVSHDLASAERVLVNNKLAKPGLKLKVNDNFIMDNVYIKKDPTFVLELHIDKDDAKEFNLENNDIVILE